MRMHPAISQLGSDRVRAMTDQNEPDTRDDDYELDPDIVAAVVESAGVRDRVAVMALMADLHVADIADLLEQIDSEARRALVDLVWADIDKEVLAELETTGIRVDADELNRQNEEVSQRIDGLVAEIDGETRTFNVNSYAVIQDRLWIAGSELDAEPSPLLALQAQAPMVTGLGTFECESGYAIEYYGLEYDWDTFIMNDCTVTLTAAGELGEPIIGSFEGTLENQVDGQPPKTISGTFNMIRLEDIP